MAHPRAGLMIHFFVRFKIRDDLLSHYLAKVNCLPSNTSIFKMKHSYSIGKTSHFRFKISFQPGKVQIARFPSPPRHVRQSNTREDVEALNWSAHNWLLSKPLISTVFFHEVTLFLLTMCTVVCFPSSSDQSKSPCFLSSLLSPC